LKIFPCRKHLLQIRDHRDLHLDDQDRRDVELHQLMDLNCDMDLMQLVHLLHLDVVQNLDVLDRRHLPDVVHLDVQQNLDEEHLVVVHLDAPHPLVAVVDAELRHLLRMDYFQDAVDVELLRLQRMDYFQDVALLVRQELELPELPVQMEHLELLCMQQLQRRLLALLHVMPSTLQDQHRALQQVQLRVLGLPLALLQQLSSPQLSLLASSLQLALHRDRAQLTCEQPVAQLLMKLIGRIRRVLVT
jgi:hypothetical protein